MSPGLFEVFMCGEGSILYAPNNPDWASVYFNQLQRHEDQKSTRSINDRGGHGPEAHGQISPGNPSLSRSISSTAKAL